MSCCSAIVRRIRFDRERIAVDAPVCNNGHDPALNAVKRVEAGSGTIPGIGDGRKSRWHAVYPDEPKACRFDDLFSRPVRFGSVSVTTNTEAGPCSFVPVLGLFDDHARWFQSHTRTWRFSSGDLNASGSAAVILGGIPRQSALDSESKTRKPSTVSCSKAFLFNGLAFRALASNSLA